MTHLLVAGKLHPAGVAEMDRLKAEGVDITYIEEISEASIADHIGQADALVIRAQRLTADTIARAGRLKVVSRHGVGYDTVDLDALNARGIALTVVGDVNSVSVAEHAMMQLLAGAKQVLRADRAVRDPKAWDWRLGMEQREISGRNLLIVGFGRAGRRLARMAAGFDMKVCAYDPYLLSSGWPTSDVAPVETLEDGLAWADFLSLHVPRTDTQLLTSKEFALMKPGVVIANTARGGLFCEDALAAALADGRVHAAGIDVFDVEPPPADMALAACDNAILSPHIAGITEEASERMAVTAVQNAIGYLNGTIDSDLVVNRAVLQGP